ncbi:MAG: hypothetical protein ACTSU9_16050 [Promethearchaeota archaeon]
MPAMDEISLELGEERTCRELGLKASLHISLGNQENIRKARGDFDNAMKLYFQISGNYLVIASNHTIETFF